jgi:hypothetical protein
LTSEKHFVINKTFLRRDFYGDHNFEKRSWFFQHFLQQRNDIQKKIYAYIETHEVQILFFDCDANLVITWSRNPHIKTPIPGKPSKSGLIGV